jgi:hypothetical protein
MNANVIQGPYYDFTKFQLCNIQNKYENKYYENENEINEINEINELVNELYLMNDYLIKNLQL